jgi:hypothetical protein
MGVSQPPHHLKTSRNIIVDHYTDELKKIAQQKISQKSHKKKGIFKKRFVSQIPLEPTDRTSAGLATLVYYTPNNQPDELLLESFTLQLAQPGKTQITPHDSRLHLYFESGMMSALSLFHNKHASSVAVAAFQPHMVHHELDQLFAYSETTLAQAAPNYPYLWIILDTNLPQILFTSSNKNLDNPLIKRQFARIVTHAYVYQPESEELRALTGPTTAFTLEDYNHALQGVLGIIPINDLLLAASQ